MKLTAILLLSATVLGGVVYYTKFLKAEAAPNFRTAEVARGDLRVEIKANGTLEPEEVVDVGAQIVGRIIELGPDLRAETDPAFKGKTVDYCSNVKQGMLLARIDPSLYKAALDQADAAVARAKADLLQMQAKLEQSEAEWKRAQRLLELKLPSVSGIGSTATQSTASTIKGISDSDYVLAKANYDVALANVGVGQAMIDQQEALRATAFRNWEFTTITSPVDGTVIARRVNIGQTVVSSLNAPSLFLIAKDLREMEIWTQVNEADIGRLKVGMPVRFSVDAFPNEYFKGTVRQIRLNAATTSNVVLYTVVVTAPNTDLRLLPYLTADVRFEVDRRTDALIVPNAALRYQPRAELVLKDDRDEADSAGTKVAKLTAMAADPPGTPAQAESKSNAEAKSSETSADAGDPPQTESETTPPARPVVHKTVWVRKGNFVEPLQIEIGVTDGVQTEVLGGDLKEGMTLVLGETAADAPPQGETNPFAPPRLRGTKRM